MPIVTVEGMIRVVTTDLAAAPLAGGGAGNSLYHAEPGDKTWNTAPTAGSPDTIQIPFTASSFTVMVQTAAVSVRVSSDGGANFGGWMVLGPGSWSFDLDATDLEIEEQGAGAEYQLFAFA